MATTTPSKRGPKVITDDETIAIINQGASLVHLAEIFGKDSRDVRKKLVEGNVKPKGERRGHLVYAIKDAAPYLVTPAYSIDEFIERMSYADLPHLTRKEFWAGMRSRQLYEKEAAELWPTSDVVDTISELFKTLRMSLLLFRENVERETEMTDRQRDIIVRLVDNAMEDLYAKTVSKFSQTKQTSGRVELRPSVDDLTDEEDL